MTVIKQIHDQIDEINSLRALVRRLRDGMNAWASDEDGVHPEAWEAYADAAEVLGEKRPCAECGKHPCAKHCPFTTAEVPT